MTKKDAIEVGQ